MVGENQFETMEEKSSEIENQDIPNESQAAEIERTQREQRAAMREIRKRKILLNAEERMAKFGVKAPISQTAKPRVAEIYPDPEVEPNLHLNLGSDNQFRNANNANANASFEELFRPLPPTKKRHFLIEWRLHIFVATILAFILTTFCPDIIGNQYIFVYVGALIIVELLFFRSPEKLNPIIDLLIVFAGVHRAHVERIIRLTSIFSSLLVDLSISIFTFCILSVLTSLVSTNSDILLKIN